MAPCIFVIFGGTGDLAHRKLLPALARMPKGSDQRPIHVLGVARSHDFDDASYRQWVDQALQRAGVSEAERNAFCGKCLHYLSLGEGSAADYDRLRERIEGIEAAHALPPNRVLYLALPPKAFSATVERLADSGLHESQSWTRLVIEKPFGSDLASAVELNRKLHQHFTEDQIYRIDHYLGKDTVQNLLVLRFANPIFESLWNRDKIHSVQITVAESLGVETRAGYYDKAGALRDMVQNHLMQLLTLTAMEIPTAYQAEEVRFEKLKVLRTISPFRPEQVVLGQYGHGQVDGEEVQGYLEEPGVAADSRTETFVALRVNLDNWRWQGVPFYLRTGKRLPHRTTHIAIRFKRAPVCLFETMGYCPTHSNLMVLTLQPNEGFALYFEVKQPGSPFAMQRIPLDFFYRERFQRVPDAYETLLADVVQGDQTLFVHASEVERSWALLQPLLERPLQPLPYRAGTWGPSQADRIRINDPLLWRVP